MPNYLKTLFSVMGVFLGSFALAYAAGLTVPQGGTGVTSITGGQLIAGAGTLRITTVATTTASCSGSASCTPFTVIGGSPITITSSGGGGTGLSTTTPLSGNSNILTYSSVGAGAAYGTATSSIGAGTGLSFSGTAGAQVGGTNGTYSVNTSQNITTLSNLTTNGFVQTSGGTGALSSAALTSGQVTTALGFTPTNYLTNSSANTFLNKGTNLQAPVLMATSTTATSTFAGDLAIGGNSGNPNPYLFIGTSTSYLPLYGRVQGDVIDSEYDWNGQSSINVANANTGSCASATFFADGNNPSLGGYYATLSFLNDGWTGVGCSIGAGTAQKPEALALASPTGEFDNIIASTTNNGSADFNWFTNTNTNVMKLTNAGRLGLSTTTPHAALAVNAPNTAPTENIFEASYSTGATNAATTTVFSIATSTGTAVNIATTSAIGSNVLTVNGGVYFHGLATGAGNGALCATTDGLVSYDAGANCIVSSARFKTLVQGLTGGTGVSEIAKLNPVSFFYKPGFGDNGTQEHVGLIAEDVAKVDPRLVIYDKDNKPFSLHFEEFIPLFVQSIQDILTRMDSQQAEIDTLKAQVKALQDAQQHPLPKQL